MTFVTNIKELLKIFCEFFSHMESDVENIMYRGLFGWRVAFYLPGKRNVQNCGIWILRTSRASVGLERYSPKMNVFCALSELKVYGLFYVDSIVTIDKSLDMLKRLF